VATKVRQSRTAAERRRSSTVRKSIAYRSPKRLLPWLGTLRAGLFWTIQSPTKGRESAIVDGAEPDVVLM
jgi:hypothetical protein